MLWPRSWRTKRSRPRRPRAAKRSSPIIIITTTAGGGAAGITITTTIIIIGGAGITLITTIKAVMGLVRSKIVIARSPKGDEAIQLFCADMDCFASLAMTTQDLT
jgi:hypothetical protein